MVDSLPPSLDPSVVDPDPFVATARIIRTLRQAADWNDVIQLCLAILGRALGGHRAILFRLENLPDRGFVQSVAAFWVDDTIEGIGSKPAVIEEAVVHSDELMGQIAEEGRQGKMFTGDTSRIAGFLRTEFERQKIKSFISIPILANGQAWGSVAINDCVRERAWTNDELAAVEIVAFAISDAIEHSVSEGHVGEVIRAAMLQASLDAVIIIDESGKIVEFNPAAEKMFGYARADIIGKDMLDTIVPNFYREGYASGADYMHGRGAPMLGRRLETVTQNATGDVFQIGRAHV